MVTVMFDCKVCGLHHEKVEVPARPSPDVPVTEWINGVVLRRVMIAHLTRSLLCEAETVDLYLPSPPNAEWVGQEV